MIHVTNTRECTGCGACVNACPKSIISLSEDREGFLYPKVKEESCIDCHLCEKACPFASPSFIVGSDKNRSLPSFYAGQLKNKEDLFYVSSGGAFWALTQTIITKEHGVVYGAVQNNVDNIEHLRVEDLDEAKALRRSKYFQSDTKRTFQQAKQDLKNGRVVLFSGTGCQIAGLLTFLGKEYDNLYTCDVVCHGIPSRKVWKKYREEKEEKEGKKIIGLVFRDKTAGWSKNQYRITYEDGSEETERSTQQLFHAGYLRGLFYRPSCGSCHFASIPRVSDITLADYWKYKGHFHEEGKDIGVSLITANTKKGQFLLDRSADFLLIEPTTKKQALESCKHLDEHPSENPKRNQFFEQFFKTGYHTTAKKMIAFPQKKNLISFIIRKLKQII